MQRNQGSARPDDFILSSPYTDPVDIKKLRFIFSAINNFACSKNIDFRDLCILEVACGRGGITLPLASLGCRVRAFDIDREAVEYLKLQAGLKGFENLTVTVDNGYTFDDGKEYHIVIASEVFEHVLHPSNLAASLARRMRDGAHLIVTTPNGYGPWELKNRMDPRTRLRRWDFLRRLLNKPPYVKGNGDDHCQFYTRGRFVGMFSDASFGLVDSARSDSFLAIFRPQRRSKWLGNLDAKLADVLPYRLASGWYFVFEFHGLNK